MCFQKEEECLWCAKIPALFGTPVKGPSKEHVDWIIIFIAPLTFERIMLNSYYIIGIYRIADQPSWCALYCPVKFVARQCHILNFLINAILFNPKNDPPASALVFTKTWFWFPIIVSLFGSFVPFSVDGFIYPRIASWVLWTYSSLLLIRNWLILVSTTQFFTYCQHQIYISI